MVTTKVRIGPQDQGRRMSRERFEFAEVQHGHRYELARGYIVVGEMPSLYHAYLVAFLRDRLTAYKIAHPERIHLILGAMESKLLIAKWDSERHPDLAVYLTAPRGPKDRTVWRRWIPELVIEVVSPSSVDRDYVEKRDEYWSLRVKEYWIVDPALEQVMVLRRGRRKWMETALKRGDFVETKLLPGFRVACADVIDAAGPADAEE